MKTRNTKHQAPEKLQCPGTNNIGRSQRLWKLAVVIVTVFLLSSALPSKGSEADRQTALEQQRMSRMAQNLAKPELKLDQAAARQIKAEWQARYSKEAEPQARMEIVTEVAQLEDGETIHMLLAWLRQEKDSGVRQQIVLILGFMRTTLTEIKDVAAGLMNRYERATDSIERDRIVAVISNLPTPESAAFTKSVFDRAAGKTAFEQKIGAARGLFKLAPRVAVTPEALSAVWAWLRTQAKEATSENERLEAARALAMPGQRNQRYLAELAASEKQPKVKKFLLLASKQYSTE